MEMLRKFGRKAYVTARGGAMRTAVLLFVGLGRRETVGVENVLKSDDAFELVDVGAADDRQKIELRRAQAFQGYGQRLIGVDMREGVGTQNVADLACGRTFGERFLKSSAI